jgi:hypothetical protein
MQPKALQIIQKVIPAGDPGEEVIDLRRPLLAGYIVFVAHWPDSSGIALWGKG